jgi:hypothetical protein
MWGAIDLKKYANAPLMRLTKIRLRSRLLNVLEAALHLGAHVLMIAKILLDDVPAGRGKQARLFERASSSFVNCNPTVDSLAIAVLRSHEPGEHMLELCIT